MRHPMPSLRTTLLLAVLFCAATAPAARALWPSYGGGVGIDGATDMAVDANGNVYVTGEFRGSAFFGDRQLDAAGLSDVFVAKLSPEGAVLWAARAGGTSIDRVLALAVDPAQNVYVTGYFFGAMEFDNDEDATPGSAPPSLPAPGYTGASAGREWYVAKIDSSGAWQWAAQVNSAGNDEGWDVAYAPGYEDPMAPIPDGIVVVGGANASPTYVNADGSVASLGTSSTLPIRVVRLDGNGNFIWRLDGGTSGVKAAATQVTVDSGGRVFVGGQFFGDTTIQTPGGTALTYTGSPASSRLSFWHSHSFDTGASCYDFGVLEYSSNGGASWFDILSGEGDNDPSTTAGDPSRFLANGYNGSWNGWENNPLGHRQGWCYDSGGWKKVEVDLDDFGGLALKLRWRFGSGDYFGSTGWYVDDVSVTDPEGQTLFLDDLEAGAGKWDIFGSTGTTPWSLVTTAANSPIHSWFVPDASVSSDHKLATNRTLTIPEKTPAYFVAKVGGAETTSPYWLWASPMPSGTSLADLAIDESLRLHAAGTARTAGAAFGSVTLPDAGAFVARLLDQGATFAWQWAKGASGGEAAGIALVAGGDLLLAGSYGATTSFSGLQNDPLAPGAGTQTASLPAPQGTDVFLARLAGDGATWRWIRSSPSPGEERATAAGAFGSSKAYIAGSFDDSAEFGEVQIVSLGATDAFVAQAAAADGTWFEVQFENWVVGAEVTPPPGPLCLDNEALATPSIELAGPGNSSDFFVWSPRAANPDDRARLVAVQPAAATISWKRNCDPADPERVSLIGASDWPRQTDGAIRYCGSEDAAAHPGEPCVQVHVAGAPVDLEPPTAGISVAQRVNPVIGTMSADATLTPGGVGQARFTASEPGFSVLLYADDPSSRNINADPLIVVIAETVPYDTTVAIRRPGGALDPVFRDAANCTIGTEIVEPTHEDHGGKNGFVLFERAHFDGAGADRAYDRATRQGQIIPVNRMPVDSDGQDVMAVAWFRKDDRTIAWPSRATRYDCRWPAVSDKIIIASELGSEVLGQPPLDPAVFPGARIYVQSDPNAPGFNPNDEHALSAPANSSSGFNAIFAVRSDFSDSERLRTSEPYVLLKYLEPGTGKWRFRIYQVLATGAGYSSFQYSGVAGNPVFPPYPVRLLGGCPQTRAKGKPAFKDYKEQVWAASAGTMVVEYWYPLQPGWWYDRDADRTVERGIGDCTAWLGGALDNPVDVNYAISWPDLVPVLTVGETLLTPKYGLPDILNQAAVEIVFDEKTDQLVYNEVYDPNGSLARIIDPLTPRSVRLPAIPEEVAADLDPQTGLLIPASNADGTIGVPATVALRLTYDPINKRLAFQGYLDEEGAGDPLLLINVMTSPERRRLKQLDGGDGSEAEQSTKLCDTLADDCSWDEAIEALYRLSRNPLQLDLDLEADRCELSLVTDPSTGLEVPEIECSSPTDGDVDNALLLGLQDEDGDGVPERLQVAGFAPALTAGFAQGTGYVTLAFNNDPSLNPLPVSLSVIRVDCLEIPRTPPPNRLSTYQGQINVIESDNVFDEALTLRHSGDFAGAADEFEFEWFFHPDEDGTPPFPLPSPDTGQMNGWLQFTGGGSPEGAIDITIEGANIQTLSDNWFVVRYRYLDPPMDSGADGLPGTADDAPLCGGTWGVYAGQPGATPTSERAQLAEGWVKRVVRGLNPFEARVRDFHASETNTYASMVYQLGERYEGDIAFNPDAGNLNSIGLIEAYTTVLNRARRLSIDGTPPVDYGPVNNAILLVASRLADFYMLLGNEGYADAQDPMIGYGTDGAIYGTLAPTVFTFQNQLASQLEEELVLLRGRDDRQGPVAARPVYNRLFWNFTSGEGEFAYALSYNITDQNLDGFVNEADARVLFPQGHGDAWGHYLTGIKTYYTLLRHPFYTWVPRPEAVLVAGVPVQVDFLDERKFAKVAAQKARSGAEIVDLTYRLSYVEDPAGQWQGYKDTVPNRAWGLAEWGRRAGQGALFDWIVGNAILPAVDPDPLHVGIQKVDRTTVEELTEIASQYTRVQTQVDEADTGLNPLGLAKGVVPFDIDPSLLDPPVGTFRKTHFEQIYDRAEAAMGNAVATFNHANKLTELLRRTQDTTESIYSNSYEQELDYKNRLIEIFGYPYDADIGPTGTYPSGYDGPDVYHYMYVDQSDLTGGPAAETTAFTATFQPLPNGIGFFNFDPSDPDVDCTWPGQNTNCALAPAPTGTLDVQYHTVAARRTRDTASGPDVADSFFLVKPAEWGDSQRRAPGELQNKLSDLLIAMNSYEQILVEYNNLIRDIEDQVDLLKATYDIGEEKIRIMRGAREELYGLTVAIGVLKGAQVALRRTALFLDATFKDTAHCIPKSVIIGVASGGDILSASACTVEFAGSKLAFALDTIADGLEIAENSIDLAKEDVEKQADLEVEILGANFEVYQAGKELEKLLREEPLKRLEAFQRREAVDAVRTGYMQELARGQRLIAEMVQFRKNTAADIQTYRYRDMAFRIFRNDALQKYRAQFDLVARYTYLAASAYDYETNLLGNSNASGRGFLTQIVKERSLGQIIDGQPVPGSRGLAGPLGQMRQNFEVLKTQLGFNNPQTETNRFSLRREALRLLEESDQEWRDKLANEFRVENLWDVPEFRRYCRPFAPESAGPQPGLVIPFETTVTFGLNFFGWPLGPGDSAYDSSNFATKIASVGVWLEDYSDLPLSQTPRVYLVPVGADVLRSPSNDLFTTREWQVVDQVLPVPFPLGAGDLEDPEWIPIHDSLSETFGQIRRFSSFRAYPTEAGSPFNPAETNLSSRLVGRSVWNRRWLLIIPGGTLLNDPNEGLERLIHGRLLPGGLRDGDGIDDIQLFFQTYAYSGI